jgi:hypothetical protein
MSTGAWKAGVATIAITPREPMWLAGWAARREPATRAAMDLFAKALVFEDAKGERAVIVTADLIAIPRVLANGVVARLQQRWDLPRARFLFNASHTHTGPEIRPDKVPFFEIPAEFAAKIPRYLAELEVKLANVIARALDRLVPVTLFVGATQASFAANRRAAGGPVDPEIPVLTVRGREDELLAMLFGYACHNLVLPPSFCTYHGDYAGVAQAYLEKQCPGAVALFLSGAGADIDPAPRGTPELCDQHGHTLAEAVLTWDRDRPRSPPKEIAPTLRIALEEVPLDLQPLPTREVLLADAASEDAPRRRKAEFLLAALAENRPLATTQLCPVQVLHFGRELRLIALGGEPVLDFALQFKREFAGAHVWVTGYSNDMFGYVPTRRVQQEGGYEAGRAALWSAIPTPVAETTEDRVVTAVRRLVQTLH